MSGCGWTGRPSEDGEIRLYTRAQCEGINGIYHANGECTRPEGGSFSYDCRKLNSDPLAILYSWKWYIGGAAAVGGVLWWRNRRRTPA
jgi:hypothetical protein